MNPCHPRNPEVMKAENPPAFPWTPTDKAGQIGPSFPGMSLRDYFAAHAPPRSELLIYQTFKEGIGASDAQLRYRYADAMLAARQPGEGAA